MDPTPFETTQTAIAGRGWGWLMAYGILCVLGGLAALLWPFPATLSVTLLVGTFLIVIGAAALIAAFGARGHETRLYSILFGVVSLVLGVMLWIGPVTGAISLTMLLAIWLGARGIMELFWGLRMRRNRGLMIVLGLINIALTILIVASIPVTGLTLPGVLLGISLLMGGVTAIASAWTHRSVV
ncbi:DUF308 domain-containing protein [Stakelama sp. CBK3Z-3]|uniref:DUF308 domain-containing protein n=2 Tax=Stakelama flava TaxID=2860338 RepID=A0ABS6XPM0_9SPHN|nr:DUF308 domain-containing protein [Stakelama flava]